ncbi:MAG: ABC transporter ATP-binding protein [Chlamydiia bacterium]|nr:ABC transporter ATP-binding protein [Chlamydiia bacterium]
MGSKEQESRQNLNYARGLVIEVHNLSKIYTLGKTTLSAVKNISFFLKRGTILGLVGESGCGKSTLGRLLLQLIQPTSGQILFEGSPIAKSRKDLQRRMQMIFQDPFSSLNPRMTVGDILEEPSIIHSMPSQVEQLLDLVGLPQNAKNRFPHEFSGGQRQRIGIARALSLNPDFIVCDEPISALDVSIQAQIVNLLLRLRKELELTYLFISHDLSMVRYISEEVAVMYQGEFVETAPTEILYHTPLHPYTQILLSSIPKIRSVSRSPAHSPLSQTAPSFVGCPFAPRCPYATTQCRQEKPIFREVAPNHRVACHLQSFK